MTLSVSCDSRTGEFQQKDHIFQRCLLVGMSGILKILVLGDQDPSMWAVADDMHSYRCTAHCYLFHNYGSRGRCRVLYNYSNVWEDFQRKKLYILHQFNNMSPWWRSSSKGAKKIRKKKADLGSIFCLIRRMLKVPSESTPSSSPTRNDIVPEIESKFHASSPSTLGAQSEKLGEVLHSYPLPPPVNVSNTGRVASVERVPTNIGSSDESSPFVFPVAISFHVQNGHNHNNVKGDLVTDSVFSDNGGECDGPSGFRLTNPQECNYQASTSPSSHVITSQKKREKRKQDEACVSTQMIATPLKQLPLTPQMANLQIPQYGGLCSAPDSSRSSPSKSPVRVVGPEPSQNDFWAMRPSADPVFLVPGSSCSPGSDHTNQLVRQNSRRAAERVSPVSSPGPSPRKQSGPPSADPGFLGPGPSSSPGSGYNSSQLSWQNCRRTPERGSPIHSHPSPRIQIGPPSADPVFLVPGPSSSSGSDHTNQLVRQNSRRAAERVSPVSSPGPSPRKQSGPPSADPGFLGPGPSSSPGSCYNSSQLSWQNCRRTPERGSPIRSHPSPRIQIGPPSADPVFLVPGPSSSSGSDHTNQLVRQNSRRAAERVSPVSSPGPSPRKPSGPLSADPGFLGPGPSSSPGSGYNSSQLSWQNCRCTPERGSPIRSHPSPRIQSGPPSADPVFLVPGPSSSSGSGYNASQLNWTNSRRTPEHGSPIPSTRMTSPGPSPRRHIGSPSANWPNDAVNGKQQAYRLPLPPGAISPTGPSSPVYSPGTTPTVPRSPGRADLVASPGSRWKTGHLLGRGAYGDVYLGFNSDTGEMRAMKEVTLSADDEREQLEEEIARLRSLRHPNIVQYYGIDTLDDKVYICLEYVGGGSVYKILQEHGAFDECIIRNYTRQILQGLVYLHSKNMIHKDIKGSNILVDTKGHIKLADFGVAKRILGPSCALPFKGSSHWTAPELIRNASKGYSPLVDIWSLGCTIQEMATTKPPWSDYNEAVALFKILHTTEIKPPEELSDEGKDFMLQCMQLDPSHRPSAAQLLDHPFVKINPEGR